MGRLAIALVAALGLLAVASASTAGAATQIGETFTPSNTFQSGWTAIQSSSPMGQYAAPSPGVITSWSFEASASGVPQGLKLKIARAMGGNDFTIIGQSPEKNPVPSALNTYTDVRIPVAAGDLIGLYMGSVDANTIDFVASGAGYGEHEEEGDFQPGTTIALAGPFNIHLDVSAILEPDCDNDGFGDETQDSVVDCAAPETTITKGPKHKTKKKRATFEFTASEPGSTFECALDGQAAFKPCTSPFTLKVKKGKHTFEVRARDPVGNVDGSPAADDWKVKKRRKK